MFELRSTPTGPMIEIFYKKDSTTDVVIPLYIPRCGYACSLSDLYELYDDIIPTQDFATTCDGTSASMHKTNIFGGRIFWIFLIFLFVLNLTIFSCIFNTSNVVRVCLGVFS